MRLCAHPRVDTYIHSGAAHRLALRLHDNWSYSRLEKFCSYHDDIDVVTGPDEHTCDGPGSNLCVDAIDDVGTHASTRPDYSEDSAAFNGLDSDHAIGTESDSETDER